MALNAGLHVEGLKELRRGLSQLDKSLAKELRKDLVAIGDEIAQEAKSLVPKRSGRAANSIRAGASGNNAYVQGGKGTVPYYGWLDFGSRRPIRGRPRSVGPWKGSGTGPKKGRFIYPTIERNQSKIERRAQASFDRAAKSLPK